MPEDLPVCFVAMPLTTPSEAVDSYGGDAEHFLHVLDHLFAPAVEKAGYQVSRPVMTGADVIQAEIIKNLEEADLVLVDISRHNPNVFFELGIRTALDRPVALVRDDETVALPFDTSILNTHTYLSGLAPWSLHAEIDKLAAHIVASADRSDGGNRLWKYFGLTQRAAPPAPGADPMAAKVDLLVEQMSQLLIREPERGEPPFPTRETPLIDSPRLNALAKQIVAELSHEGVKVKGVSILQDGTVQISSDGTVTRGTQDLLSRVVERHMVPIAIKAGPLVFRASPYSSKDD